MNARELEKTYKANIHLLMGQGKTKQEAMNASLSLIMQYLTVEMIKFFHDRKINQETKGFLTIEVYLTKYRSFAKRVDINPEGYYTALKVLKPELIFLYDQFKERYYNLKNKGVKPRDIEKELDKNVKT